MSDDDDTTTNRLSPSHLAVVVVTSSSPPRDSHFHTLATKGQLKHFPPFVVRFASLKDSNWHVEGGESRQLGVVNKFYLILLRPRTAATKKQQNGDRQGMSKAIRHALMIANFTIDRPAPLEINRKIATMGGGRFSSCQKIGLSLFGVCLFFGGFWPFKKLGLPPKKIIGGKTCAGPPS